MEWWSYVISQCDMTIGFLSLSVPNFLSSCSSYQVRGRSRIYSSTNDLLGQLNIFFHDQDLVGYGYSSCSQLGFFREGTCSEEQAGNAALLCICCVLLCVVCRVSCLAMWTYGIGR